MPAPSIFDEQEIDLREYEFTEKIKKFIIDTIETVTGGILDRSEAEFEELKFDRAEMIAKCRAKVKAKNSNSAAIPVSVTSEFSFKYDAKNQSFSDEKLVFKTQLPKFPSGTQEGPDISIPIGKVKELLEGDFSKALELIPNGGVVKRDIRSNYDEIKAKFVTDHGEENVYFASVRFVRFASLGTAGRWVATAIQTGGVTAADIIKEVAKEASKELSLVVEWLRSRSADFLSNVGENIAEEILTGKRPSWPNVDFPGIHFRWQKVIYSSRLLINGSQVGGSFAENPHAAFVLIWKGANGSTAAITGKDADAIPVKDERPDTPEPSLPNRFKAVPGYFGVAPAAHTDLFVYDSTGGNAQVKAAGSGSTPLPIQITGLPTGAAIDVIPGFFAGSQQFTDLAFYNRVTGAIQFFTTNALGNITSLGSVSLPSGRRIVTGSFGTPGSHSDLFIYDPAAGTALIRGADGSGGLSAAVSVGGLPTGTAMEVIPGFFAGSQQFTDLAFYNRATGATQIFTTNGLGNIQNIGSVVLSANRRMIAGNFGAPPAAHSDLLIYDPATGTAQVRGANGSGGLSAPVSVAGLPVGTAMEVVPGYFAGGQQFTDLAFCDRSTGETRAFTTNGLGNITEI